MIGAAAIAASAMGADEPGAPVQVALVGAAHIHTPQFINILKGRNDVKTVAVWDHDGDRAARRAGELGAPVVKDVAEIWKNDRIKAVVVCSETDRHRDLVLAAAAAGKHLFVEKPLGISARDSMEMADAIEKARVLFSTGYFMRSSPVHQYLKKQVEAGVFGKITRVHHANCHSGSLGGWFDTEWRWMADPRQAGVGAFGDLGTHSLDILMWMFGAVDAVCADIKVVTGRYGDCDESGLGLMRFNNGATGSLAAGWVDVANPITMEISGTEGHACIVRDKVYLSSNKVPGADGGKPVADLPRALPHAFVMWVNAVTGNGESVLVAPREAAARVAVMEAMYRSARERKWTEI